MQKMTEKVISFQNHVLEQHAREKQKLLESRQHRNQSFGRVTQDYKELPKEKFSATYDPKKYAVPQGMTSVEQASGH